MKKILVLVTILILCATFIIGCSNNPATTPASTTPAPTSTTPAPTSTTSTPISTTTKPASPTATAATPPPTSTSAAKSGGTLKFVYWASPSGTGGMPAELFGNDFLSSQLCIEPLLQVSAKGEVTPCLAESYKVADDLKSITFNLRKGVKFHDGTDFNAKAAKWNLDNELATKRQAYWTSIEIIDDYSIRLNLNQWANTVLTGLASGASYMVSPTAFEKNGIDWMRANPVGTGPYKFVSFKRDVNYKTVKNPDYWNKGKPYLEGVELIYAADQMTQKALILSGSVDVLQVEPGRNASELQAAGINMAMSVTSTFCMLPDTTHADSPFANQKVREAVEYAIDREAIAKAFSYGYWQAPYQIPSPSSSAHNPNFSLARKFDLTKAKQLMSEAGYPNGFNATLLVIPVGMDKDIPLAIQANLSKIGIKLEVSVPAIIPKFLQDSNTIHNALVLQPIFGGGNWNGALSFALRPGMTNMNGVWLRTPEFINLYNATMTSRVPDVNLIRAATDYLSKEAHIIPVFSGGSGYAMQNSVMDGGWFGRGSDWKPEEIWLNK